MCAAPFRTNVARHPGAWSPRRALCFAAIWGGALVAGPSALAHDPDLVAPPPREIRYLGARLPPGVHDYREYETGFIHTMLQVRFALPSRSVAALAARLPCRLGPVTRGPPEYARVGTNDRAWYVPEAATRHRGCSHHRGLRSASILVDESDPNRAVVYVVIGIE